MPHPKTFTDSETGKKYADEVEKNLGEATVTFGHLAVIDKSVDWYMDDGSESINSYHRDPATYNAKHNPNLQYDYDSEKAILSHSVQIDKVLAAAPVLKGDIEIFRGLKGDYADEIAKSEIGEDITDKAYQSFSLNPNKALTDFTSAGTRTIIRAITDGKQRAIYTNKQNEHEVLFGRNTAWTVVGKDSFNNGNDIIHLITVRPKK
jgi:hypothetical protein